MGRPGDRRDIQGLRALAVVLVIVDHLAVPGVAGGYLGVDVFFVVSGFLITGLLLREHDTRGRVSISTFYARRARRILPAATVVLVATGLYAAWTLSLSRVQEVLTDGRWSAFFAANWHFSQVGTDYFAQGRADSPLQHFWSLAVEEQFYIVWPGLLALVLVGPWGGRRLAGAVLAGIWSASLACAVVLLHRSATEAYFSSFTRAWELATGALLGVAAGRLATMRLPGRQLLGAAGLVAVLTSAVTFDEGSGVPGLPALLPVAGTAAVLAAGTGPGRPGVVRLLGLAPLTWVGDASYSLYLWHWPVFVLGAERLHLSRVAEGVVLVAVTVVLSEISYRVVEQPFRTGRVAFTTGRRALALWPAALAMVLASGVLADAHASAELDRSREAARKFYANHPQTRVRSRATGTSRAQVTAELALGVAAARAADPVPPDLVGLDLTRQRWEPRFCHAGFDDTSARLCPIGDRHSDVTVVALGDSHMGQWLAALDRDGRSRHYRVVPLIKFGCPPYDVPIRWGPGVYTSCQPFRDWTATTIRALAPDSVVVGQSIDYDKIYAESRPAAIAGFEAGVRSMLERLELSTNLVVVLSDLSERGAEPAACLSDAHGDLGDCMIQQGGDPVDGNPRVGRIAASLGARYVDLTPTVCADGGCPLVADGQVLYADYGHLSVAWARHVSAAFGQLVGLPRAAASPAAALADDFRAALALAEEGAPVPVDVDNLDRLDRDRWQEHYCHAGGAHTDHRLCPLGDLSSGRLLVAWGDSHLGQWLPALDRLGSIAGYRVLPFVKGGCPPYDVRVLAGAVEFTQCPAFRAWAIAQITALHPEVIVVAGRSDFDRITPTLGLSVRDDWARGVSSQLQRLVALSPEVLVLADTTDPQFEPADCLTTTHADLGDCAFAMSQDVIDANAELRRLARAAGARFVDVVPLVCRDGRCPMVVDRLVTFADFGHVSMSWARAVARAFTDRCGLGRR